MMNRYLILVSKITGLYIISGTILPIFHHCDLAPHSTSCNIQILQVERYLSNAGFLVIHLVNEDIHINCECEACRRKTQLLQKRQKMEAFQFKVIRNYLLLAIGWSIVGYMIYRVITTKVENRIWDPYAILGLSSSAPLKQIKSHYKKLSRTLHPDKIKLIGNMTKEEVEKKFVDITKAYKAYFTDC
jgi:preprotein translocase subunit Sec63